MKPSTLFLRLISALILAPVIVGLTFLGGWAIYILTAAAVALSLREWAAMTSDGDRIVWPRLFGGGLYIVLAMAALVYIREQPDGAAMLLYILVSVWLADTFAYVFGKKIGGPKLAPTISPNKTWAGLFGACFGAVAGVLLVEKTLRFIPELPIPTSFDSGLFIHIVKGIFIGLIGQVGDLLISYYKRKAGVKDTGQLIPGHGGILDRIDGLLLVGLLTGLLLWVTR